MADVFFAVSKQVEVSPIYGYTIYIQCVCIYIYTYVHIHEHPCHGQHMVYGHLSHIGNPYNGQLYKPLRNLLMTITQLGYIILSSNF